MEIALLILHRVKGDNQIPLAIKLAGGKKS